tara:strand:+ start:419 stop:670 length:252 start_codon:yes stop_codon:yes gene_type:complete
MNKQIRKLVDQAGFVRFSAKEDPHRPIDWSCDYTEELDRFAELIVRECRKVIDELYHKTPLELCGPLLTADEEIAKHFYGIEK